MIPQNEKTSQEWKEALATHINKKFIYKIYTKLQIIKKKRQSESKIGKRLEQRLHTNRNLPDQ